MARRDLSLAVVGVAYANSDGSNRQFEVAMCTPGEPVALVPEPTNKADPGAVAVYSARGLQIGYLSADRCVWIGGKLRQGQEIKAIFQQGGSTQAVIRINLDGEAPSLPTAALPDPAPPSVETDSGFWPDDIPDDF